MTTANYQFKNGVKIYVTVSGNAATETINDDGILSGFAGPTLLFDGSVVTSNGATGITEVAGNNANTIYVVDNRSDVIWGGASTNTIVDQRTSLIGGGQGDVFVGGNGGNKLVDAGKSAIAYTDVLLGGTSKDQLTGGAGNDILMGGGAADLIQVGSGHDQLLYFTKSTSTVSDSSYTSGAPVTTTMQTWDIVQGFRPGVDRFVFDSSNVVSGIAVQGNSLDASLTGGGPPLLEWIGAQGTDPQAGVANAARVHAVWQDANHYFVYADINGDGKADLKIQVASADSHNVWQGVTLGAADFSGVRSGPPVTIRLAHDTGSSASDGLTNDPALTGTTDASILVTLSEGGQVVGTTTSDSNGQWHFTPQLADGLHAFTVVARDVLGNTRSNALSFTVDTSPPPVTVALSNDTGVSSSDGITSDSGLAGTTEANSLVTLLEDGGFMGTTTSDASGQWDFTSQLSDGPHTVTAVVTDAAGNTGSASRTFTVDTSPPVVTVTLAHDVGISSSDHVGMTGTTDALTSVTFIDDGLTIGVTLADASGQWSFTPQLADGQHTITIQGSDIAGNLATETVTLALANATEDGATSTLNALADASDPDLVSVVGVPAALPAGVTYSAGSYSFTLDASNAAFQHLAQGEQTTVTVNYGVTDGIATMGALVSWTVTGTDDAPAITAATTSATGSVTEDDAMPTLSCVGTIAFDDVDLTDAHTTSVAADAGNMLGGTLALGAVSESADTTCGTVGWTYQVADEATQYLAAGQTVTETFTVTIDDGHGGTVDQTVMVTVTGTNDTATVSSQSRSVSEGNTAAALNASGQLAIADPDTGEAHVVARTGVHGTYGDFTIDANGAWTYTGNGAHNELTVGQQVQDQFTVTSQDGTATGTVTVTITGTNDSATVSSQSRSVSEGNAAAALNASGQLTIADPDTGEAHVVARTGVHGTYGDFAIDANGAWTYTGTGAHDELTAGQAVQDQFTVTSQDGTATGTVTVTITGTNDTAVIGGVSAGDVTEDSGVSAGNIVTGGALTIADPDQGQSSFVPQTSTAGSHGYGTFDLSASGVWTYAASNSQSAIQQLDAGQTLTDSFTVMSLDGSASRTVTVTIHGADELTETLVGAWRVGEGPYWGTAPAVYSGQQAAALLFGGQASDYQVSTSSTSITHTAYYDGYGQPVSVFAEDYSVDSPPAGYSYPDYSAFVADHVVVQGFLSSGGYTATQSYPYTNYAYLAANVMQAPMSGNLTGTSGTDKIVMAAGSTVAGGGGNDYFLFSAPSASATHITDFDPAHDTLLFDHTTFGGSLQPGGVATTQFTPGGFTTVDQRFSYSAADGSLFFDADGSGGGSASVLVTILGGHPVLNHYDLVLL